MQKYSFPLSELCSKLKIFPTVDFAIRGQFKEALVIISIYISLSFEIELLRFYTRVVFVCARRPPNQCNGQVPLYCRQRGDGFCTSDVQWQFSYGLRYKLIVSKQPILKFWIILIAQHNIHSLFATKILTKFLFFRGCCLK